jgi:hypothetical protein
MTGGRKDVLSVQNRASAYRMTSHMGTFNLPQVRSRVGSCFFSPFSGEPQLAGTELCCRNTLLIPPEPNEVCTTAAP